MAGKSTFRVTVVVLRVCVGLMLVYTGGEKLFRLDDFTRDVANYRMVLPPWDGCGRVPSRSCRGSPCTFLRHRRWRRVTTGTVSRSLRTADASSTRVRIACFR